jgi:hypothetical protein
VRLDPSFAAAASVLCTFLVCCLAGLTDGQAVAESDEAVLSAIISFVFPEASSEDVVASIRSRPQRVSAYN